MSSNDPEFEQKAADIIELYLNPPAHAAVFCVDEKTAIQALDRNDPVLPLCRGGPNGTGSSTTGTAGWRYTRRSIRRPARCSARPRRGTPRSSSWRFCARSWRISRRSADSRDCRQPSAHKIKRVQEFLSEHPTVKLHYTPTYSSWLNQVELWFAKTSRDVIARGLFSSVADLRSKLMRYIREYNKNPRVVKWHYVDPSRHIGA